MWLQVIISYSHHHIWQVIKSLLSGYLLGSKENLASSIRFIQVYTCQENYSANGLKIITNIYKFLIKDSYFAKIRHLIDTKIPPLLSITTRPPTPISEEILQMIVRPLDIVDSAQDKAFVNDILRQLCEHIFCKDFSDQVRDCGTSLWLILFGF